MKKAGENIGANKIVKDMRFNGKKRIAKKSEEGVLGGKLEWVVLKCTYIFLMIDF